MFFLCNKSMASSSQEQQPLKFSRGSNVVDGTLEGGTQGAPLRTRGVVRDELKPKITVSRRKRLGNEPQRVRMKTADPYVNFINGRISELEKEGYTRGQSVYMANGDWFDLAPEEKQAYLNKGWELSENDAGQLQPKGRSRLVQPTEEELYESAQLGLTDAIYEEAPAEMEEVLNAPELFGVYETSDIADMYDYARTDGFAIVDGKFEFAPDIAQEQISVKTLVPAEQETIEEARAGKAPAAEARKPDKTRAETSKVMRQARRDATRQQEQIDKERAKQRTMMRQKLTKRLRSAAEKDKTIGKYVKSAGKVEKFVKTDEGFQAASGKLRGLIEKARRGKTVQEGATQTRPPRPGRAAGTQASAPRAARDFAPRPPEVREPGITVPTQTVTRTVIDAPTQMEPEINNHLARLSTIGEANSMELGSSIGGLGRAFSPLVILASIFTLSGENSIAFIVTGSVVSFFTDIGTGIISLLATLSVVGAVPAGIITLLVGLANPLIFAISGGLGVLVWQAGKHTYQYFTSEDPEEDDDENDESTFYSLREKRFVKVPKESVVDLKLENGRTVKHTVYKGEKLYRLYKEGNEDA